MDSTWMCINIVIVIVVANLFPISLIMTVFPILFSSLFPAQPLTRPDQTNRLTPTAVHTSLLCGVPWRLLLLSWDYDHWRRPLEHGVRWQWVRSGLMANNYSQQNHNNNSIAFLPYDNNATTCGACGWASWPNIELRSICVREWAAGDKGAEKFLIKPANGDRLPLTRVSDPE